MMMISKALQREDPDGDGTPRDTIAGTTLKSTNYPLVVPVSTTNHWRTVPAGGHRTRRRSSCIEEKHLELAQVTTICLIVFVVVSGHYYQPQTEFTIGPQQKVP